MDIASAVRLLRDLTDDDGTDLGKYRFRLPPRCSIAVDVGEQETSLSFSPPARAGREFLQIALLTKWVECPRIVLGASSLRIELAGLPDQIVPYERAK